MSFDIFSHPLARDRQPGILEWKTAISLLMSVLRLCQKDSVFTSAGVAEEPEADTESELTAADGGSLVHCCASGNGACTILPPLGPRPAVPISAASHTSI
jgi:hypothetical protein